jgi:hypothetical protein
MEITMFPLVPKLKNVEEAVVHAEVALALLKEARGALRAKRSAQTLGEKGLKRLQLATLAMFGGESKAGRRKRCMRWFSSAN